MSMIDTIKGQSLTSLEMGVDGDQDRLRELADGLISLSENDWQRVLEDRAQFNYDLRVATYMAESRKWVQANEKDISVGIVFAMWGEHTRLQQRTADNPNGENSLLSKVRQLRWLTQDSQVSWTLYAVDDGDPKDSAAVAEQIVEANNLEDNVEVLRLTDVLGKHDEYPGLAGLSSADDSRKGGAIIYGCSQAVKDGNDAVIYTDADISVHLAQIGLLLAPFAAGEADVVIGDRKLPSSMVVKDALRWGPGVTILRFFQKRIGRYIFTNGINDTQAPFKLYSAKALGSLLDKVQTYGFALDTEWLMLALKHDHKIASVPFAFVDSFAESATKAQGAGTTWYSLLNGLAQQAQHHDVDRDKTLTEFVLTEIPDYHTIDAIIAATPSDDLPLADPQQASESDTKAVMDWVRSLG